MTREPSLATLKALAEAAVRYVGPNGERMGSNDGAELAAYVSAYRAEIAPRLRTRAEVDAEIVSVIRERCQMASSSFSGDRTRWEHLQALCVEPTAPEAEKPVLVCTICGLTSDQEPSVTFRYSNNASGHRVGVVRCNDCHRPGMARPLP